MGGTGDEGISAREYFEYSAARPPSRHAARLCRMLAPAAGPLRILDLGCGAAFTASQIADSLPPGTVAAGCDTDLPLLRLAAREHKSAGRDLRLVCNSGDTLPFGDGTFDAVFSQGALHHFDNPGAMTREMWRVLKPGGLLLLVDLNPAAHVSGIFRLYVNLKNFLGIAKPGEKALARSIREAAPRREVEALLARAGIPASAEPTLASLRFSAVKPGAAPLSGTVANE